MVSLSTRQKHVLSMWRGSPHQTPALSAYAVSLVDINLHVPEDLQDRCEALSAAEEGMTVEAYRALNERRLNDPFCD
jgi:hypothetical protein